MFTNQGGLNVTDLQFNTNNGLTALTEFDKPFGLFFTTTGMKRTKWLRIWSWIEQAIQ